jgi:hypothetical protein
MKSPRLYAGKVTSLRHFIEQSGEHARQLLCPLTGEPLRRTRAYASYSTPRLRAPPPHPRLGTKRVRHP